MHHNIFWVDVLRVISILGVVLLHTILPLLYMYNELSALYWNLANILDSLARVCVPLFLMVSGYLLLDKAEQIKRYYLKRFKKVLIPFFVWSVLYIFWDNVYLKGGTFSVGDLFGIVVKPAYYHLWYLYVICGIYLLIPAVWLMIRENQDRKLNFYIIVWYFFLVVYPYVFESNISYVNIEPAALFYYSGYFILGKVIGKLKLDNQALIVSILLYIVSLIVTVYGTYLLTVKNAGDFIGYYYSYLSPNVIVMSVSAFVIIKYISESQLKSCNGKCRGVFSSIAACSFGVYLVHPVILSFMLKNNLDVIVLINYIGFSLSIVFIFSWFFSLCLKKVPVFRRTM